MIVYVHFPTLECVTDMSQRCCGEAARLQGWPMSEEWHREGDEHFKEFIVPETWASLCTSSGLPRQSPFMCLCEPLPHSCTKRSLIQYIRSMLDFPDNIWGPVIVRHVFGQAQAENLWFPLPGWVLPLVQEIKGRVDLWKSWNSWMINFWPC